MNSITVPLATIDKADLLSGASLLSIYASLHFVALSDY